MKLLIPPPLVAVICGVGIWLVAKYFPAFSVSHPMLMPISYLFIAAGLVIDVTSVLLFLKRNTTVTPLSPDKTSSLVFDGFYKVSRNPMYLGMAFILTGWVFYCGNVLGVCGLLVFIWYITKFQIKPEEEILKVKFGEAYFDYSNRVRRWI